MTRKEFLKLPENKKQKDEIQLAAMVSYIVVVLTGISAIMTHPVLLLLAVIPLVLGLGIQFLQSRICAILFFLYYTLDKVLVFWDSLQMGEVPGVGFIIMIFGFITAFFGGMRGTIKFQRAWKQYQNGEGIVEDHNTMF